MHCKLNEAQIATTSLIAALYFNGNHTKACGYVRKHHQFTMIDKSGFSRRLHRLQTTLLIVFRHLANTLKQINTSARYIIERSGVPVLSSGRLP